MDLVAATEQERRLLALIAPEAERLRYEIVRVRLSGGRRPVLQVMIDREGGALADVEDCAKLSRKISGLLDERDPISGAYVLEVSTPGIDRPLTRPGDFGRWAGHLAKLELRVPADGGRKRFQGTITEETADGTIRIELDDGESELETRLEELAKASLVLTDELIDDAQSRGSLPPQPDDEGGVDGFEVDTNEDETDTED